MSEERKAAERLAVKGMGAILLIVFLFWAIPQIWDKLSPFIIAIPLAAALQPVVLFAKNKLKIKSGISVLICVVLMLGAGGRRHVLGRFHRAGAGAAGGRADRHHDYGRGHDRPAGRGKPREQLGGQPHPPVQSMLRNTMQRRSGPDEALGDGYGPGDGCFCG